MKKPLIAMCVLLTSAAGLAACSNSEAGLDTVDYRTEIEAWRAGRLERLLAPTGYLNQTGLFWLQPGRYRFGTAADNDIVLSGDGAAHIGVFEVDEFGVMMTVAAGIDVRHRDQPVASIDIESDLSDDAVTITHRRLAWSVVERVGRFGIRLRDFDHPFVDNFGPLPYYDIDPEFRVKAVLRRYESPVIADVGTVIEGLGYHPESPGLVEFELRGDTYRLEAYASGEELFYVFGDRTNRDATYGAGRFLYSATAGEDGTIILDFNKAYSPPCAFNDFSTCPVASPRNRLPLRIEAGEKFDALLHYSPET